MLITKTFFVKVRTSTFRKCLSLGGATGLAWGCTQQSFPGKASPRGLVSFPFSIPVLDKVSLSLTIYRKMVLLHNSLRTPVADPGEGPGGPYF